MTKVLGTTQPVIAGFEQAVEAGWRPVECWG